MKLSMSMKRLMTPTITPVIMFIVFVASAKNTGTMTISYQMSATVTVIQRKAAGISTDMTYLGLSFFLTQIAMVSITTEARSWLAPEKAGHIVLYPPDQARKIPKNAITTDATHLFESIL